MSLSATNGSKNEDFQVKMKHIDCQFWYLILKIIKLKKLGLISRLKIKTSD